VARREVEFRVEDGTLLRGYLHAPADLPAPGVVMAHGFSGVKEQIDHYAARFAERGFAVLVHDHRGFGSSEGAPRHELDPARQLSDWQDAVTFALTQPEFRPEGRVGIWGSSFAGGLAMVLAANDPRVGSVVAQIPNVSGHRNGRQMFNVEQRARLRAAFAADRRARAQGAAPATIPVFTSDPGELCALPPAVTPRYLQAISAMTPTWSNEVTLRSLEHALEFEPAGWVPHVAPTPLLMIVGENDTCTFPEIQLEVYASAREPKRLVVHPGGHFDTYVDHFDLTSEAAVEWFHDHLTSGAREGAGGPRPDHDNRQEDRNAHV